MSRTADGLLAAEPAELEEALVTELAGAFELELVDSLVQAEMLQTTMQIIAALITRNIHDNERKLDPGNILFIKASGATRQCYFGDASLARMPAQSS